LYRTWRPKTFSDLVGQDAVVRTLRTALTSGKLAHAYLFSGPRGSGKTSAAKILARCIDCELGPTPEPDNTCENCRAILTGTALDVIEVDAASNRGIDEIRALRESVKFAPSSMRMKVFIIDEAHMLTREGANAFLKTLEEPPAHAVFILATTAPEALPATILSRCQRYAFRRIPVGVMIERMREISAAEGIAIDDGALGAIAYRADGGLRDALTMLEQVASYAGGAVDAATVEAAFGATGRQYARGLVDAVLAGNGSGALRIVDVASDAGADMLGLVRGAIAEYRNLLVARIDPDLLGRDLSRADADAVLALASATPQPKVVRGLRLLADALAAGRNSGNPRLELETAILRLIVQSEDPSVEALATRVALLEAGAAPRDATAPVPVAKAVPVPSPVPEAIASVVERVPRVPEPGPVLPTVPDAPPVRVAPAEEPRPVLPTASEPPANNPPSSAPPSNAPPSLQQVRSLWDRIRLRAEEKSKPIMAQLSRATVDAVEGNAVVIGVIDSLQESLLRDRIAILEAAIADVLLVPLRVIVKGRPAVSATPMRTSAQRAKPAASAGEAGGEIDLMAYARERIGGSENS
jgi:DNA polymerase-3 subunit gamma/tau